MKQKLMVVCGGQSSEHIVSRMSCTSVMNNLNKENYDVTLVGIDQDGSWYILDQNHINTLFISLFYFVHNVHKCE